MTEMLVSMTEKLSYQLRSEQKLTSCIAVKIRYSDFNTYTMQSRIAYTSLDFDLLPRVKELFNRLFRKRMLIRLIGVQFSGLVHGNYQYNMFDDTKKQLELCRAMDKLKKRYGSDIVKRAAGISIKLKDTHPRLKDKVGQAVAAE